MISDLKEGPAILANKSGWIIAGSITKFENSFVFFTPTDSECLEPLKVDLTKIRSKFFQSDPLEDVLKWLNE